MSERIISNIIFDELQIGQSATITRTLTQKDIELFAAVSGDVNPAHLDEDYAKDSIFQGVIGHGMWSGGLISAVLGTVLPGPGTIYLGQELRFEKPVRLEDEITVTLTVKSKREDKHIVVFDCICINEKHETVVEGTATVLAPTKKVTMPLPAIPKVDIQPKDHYDDVLSACRKLGRIKVAVVHPVKANAIESVLEAYNEGLIDPILIGPKNRILEACQSCEIDSNFKFIDTEHSHAAAAKAAELAAKGEVDAIMKGSLHTDELLGSIVSSSSGLRTERRISHTYIMNIPTYHKPLMISDAAINIAPTLGEKADITRNAIDLWRVLFGPYTDRKPKVAILSAVETVVSNMPSTLDAAALCKMADRGQIVGGLLDGPLAFDNAISSEAAKDKGIVSDVAGDADILIVPNIESGNALAKQLIFLGKADAAGIVLGARVPVILTSRADSTRTRIFSCAIAVGLSYARKEGKIK